MENKSVKFENGVLTVPTPKGNIVVRTICDEDYSSVEINFESNDIKDSCAYYEDGKMPIIPLSLVEYNAENKALATFVWENPKDDDYTYKGYHTNALMFNEDFKILEDGTKIIYDNETAFIMGNDAENCPDGYEDSLNYYIKYSLENETYQELLKRIKDDDNWYDTMILWDSAEVVQD